MAHNDLPDLSSLINDPTWFVALRREFRQPYFIQLENNLRQDYAAKTVIYPQNELIFKALNLTPLNQVKVVILGQDPYHNGQAEGLAFSVSDEKLTLSLRNIFTVLAADIPGFKAPHTGSLVKWAQQGVLLLNTTLTVEKKKPNSHKDYGWKFLTNRIIKIISDQCPFVVFILWGKVAQEKENLINKDKHLVMKDAHLSPLSFDQFKEWNCFSQANTALSDRGLAPIDWHLVSNGHVSPFPMRTFTPRIKYTYRE